MGSCVEAKAGKAKTINEIPVPNCATTFSDIPVIIGNAPIM